MSFTDIIYTILISPLQLLFEVIFSFAYRVTDNPGITIVVMSLSINLLVLPLYRRADAMQEEERDIQKKLQRGVNHIKKTFHGDERMLMLQAYYRCNDYKPTYVLRGAMSLFLEIPFFIAAYHFLSELPLLLGESFGPISDLSQPDSLITIAGISVNLLPILMTLVNIVSSAVFSKDYPLKTKIQLYGMALFFLVFLYSSPSGLVFYWTLNNLFSLVKTIFYKLKNPGKILKIIASASGLFSVVFAIRYVGISISRVALFGALGLGLQLPLIMTFFRDKRLSKTSEATDLQLALKEADGTATKEVKRFLTTPGMFLCLLTGALIPSAVIQSSPLEFVNITAVYNPVWYVISALCLSFGLFVVWFGIFRGLFSTEIRKWFDRVLYILCGVALADYFFFGRNLGDLTASLQYENGMSFSAKTMVINAVVLMLVSAFVMLLAKKWKRILTDIIIAGALAVAVMSIYNIYQVNSAIAEYVSSAEANNQKAEFGMSTSGKNVVVIMLDRALGEYTPYIFSELPKLQDEFDGFTLYTNVISFGGHTNFASPALFGGYEYTPEELNKRDNETLESKQNEALKVLPVLFDENGYDVTVCDPSYAGYKWIPDLSIYNDYPNIHAYNTMGTFQGEKEREEQIKDSNRNFFCYSITKITPLFIEPTLYDGGNYHNLTPSSVNTQVREDEHTAKGLDSAFMNAYAVLENLPNMTRIDDSKKSKFLMMTNDTTHEPMILQKPYYEISENVDNSDYEEEDRQADEEFLSASDRVLRMEDGNQISSYHSNVAAYRELAKWFDYLREQGVYDNTRIILVSDHGFGLKQMEELVPENHDHHDRSYYYPMLMVKDFDATGFGVSEEFMTNADVATLATEGLVKNATNPFTGKAISNADKTAHPQHIIESDNWEIDKNNGNTFERAKWFSVSDCVWNMEEWQELND